MELWKIIKASVVVGLSGLFIVQFEAGLIKQS